ncbi:hypothetical protein HPB50_005589 [Hyalomma asiaticum]|uniref:Uncharacterized protein n=1 Tax=Hyalomma asiaticum TaxID=266040 RepID=A0ACB7S2X5_HYAAI|nr:hypothetical protein HPB50_005589 [Hyalomma asiaticum]
MLIYRPRRLAKPTGESQHCEEMLRDTQGSSCISRVPQLRTIGMPIAANGSNAETICKIEGKVTTPIRLIKRITNRHTGMKKDSFMLVIGSFGIIRISYVSAFYTWNVTRREADYRDETRRATCNACGWSPPSRVGGAGLIDASGLHAATATPRRRSCWLGRVRDARSGSSAGPRTERYQSLPSPPIWAAADRPVLIHSRAEEKNSAARCWRCVGRQFRDLPPRLKAKRPLDAPQA